MTAHIRTSSSLSKFQGLLNTEPKTPRVMTTTTSSGKFRILNSQAIPISRKGKHSDILEKVIELRKSNKQGLSLGGLERGFQSHLPASVRPSHASSPVPMQDLATARRMDSTPPKIHDTDVILDSTDSPRLRLEHINSKNDYIESTRKSRRAVTDEFARRTANSLWSYTPKSPQIKTVNSPLHSLYLGQPRELEDIYKAAKEVGQEIRSITLQECEEGLMRSMRDINVKEFLELQRTRISNVTSIIEKIFLPKGTKDSKMNQEIWMLVSTELGNVVGTYENFLRQLDELYYKASTGKEKIALQVDVWKSLRYLVDYSNTYRKVKEAGENPNEDLSLKKVKQNIMKFKLDFKLRRSFDPFVMDMYELVEQHISNLDRLIDGERDRVNLLMAQHQKEIENFQEFQEMNNEIKGDFMKMIQESKEVEAARMDGGLSMMHINSLEKRLNELQAENTKLISEREQWKKKLKKNKEKFKELELKVSGDGSKSQDKAVMADFYNPASQESKSPSLSSYFIEPVLFKNGSLLPSTLTYAMLNMIYADKMITDLVDDYEKRPRKALYEFLPQWFLKKFGLYTFCESLIKDFMYTIHYEKNPESRISFFQTLLGTQTLSDYDQTGPSGKNITEIDQQKMKRECYKASEVLKKFFGIVNNIKFPNGTPFVPPSQTSLATPQFSRFGPFLPLPDSQDNLIDNDLVRQVLYAVLREERFSESDIRSAEDQFNLIQQKDLYDRLMDGSISPKKDDDSPRDKRSVRVDLFIKVLLDIMIERDIKLMEKYHTLLKINMSGKNDTNLTFDEFTTVMIKVQPTASQIWRERAFAKFIDTGDGDVVPLNQLMLNFVPCYYREGEAKDSHSRSRIKKETIILTDKDQSPGRKDQKKLTVIQKSQQSLSTLEPSRTTLEPTKNIGGVKEAFTFSSSSLNESAYEMYDGVSSLIMLKEIYDVSKEIFTKSERRNEIFVRMHEEFIGELNDFLKSINGVVTADALITFGKKNLVCYSEHLWMKFRQILAYAHRLKS